MDYRLELLTMREQVMERLDCLIDTQLCDVIPQEDIDDLIAKVCDTVCETIDPAGFP